MSPRRTPPSASQSRPSSPYNVQTRQASAPPKKKREQFSACGACRMRRVRCDLKDVQPSNTGQVMSCSNCRERGLKCVDEFAEVKAVKLLRRGRRLQQAEAVYGKVPPEEAALRSVTPPPSVIPRLAPEFFESPFFWRLQIQRPILEPAEFRQRYVQFTRGKNDALQVPGQLLAMALVVWAASFGVNEYGVEDSQETSADIRQRKENVNEMLQELLYLIDLHGILRKASWDGVRLLLLLLPLTQEIQSPMDRLVMFEATLSHIYNLCSLGPAASVTIGQGDYVDALVRARVFWYGYVIDGVASALRGGRILLTDDELTAFEVTLPSRRDNSQGSTAYELVFRYMGLPIRISSLCRDIHSVLTGPKARQKEELKEDQLQYIWDGLDRSWKELDGLRNLALGDIIDPEDLERFIHGWQIFIFECHNVIREALKQRLVSQPPQHTYSDTNTELTRRYERILRVHEKAKIRCQNVVRDVVGIIQRNLGTSFFQYDASLVRDGCFFAAFLLAGETGSSTDVEACLQALSEMRWVYSKSEERMHTVRMVWQSRMQQTGSLPRTHSASPMNPSLDVLPGSVIDHSGPRRNSSRTLSIPPLTIPKHNLSRSSSAPNTACTGDGSWSSNVSTESLQTSQPASARSLHDSPLHNTVYLGSPLISGMPDGQAPADAKGGLIASSSALLPPSVPSSSGSAFDRAMGNDQGYYYTQYQYSIEGPSSGSSTHAAHSATASSLPVPSYHQDLSYSLDGHAGPSVLPAASGNVADHGDCVFSTDTFYQ